ncbi:MAG: hypothetical protein RR540_00150 [Oscillospiraceae bacterium]
MKKKILALVMTLLMGCAILPTALCAADKEETKEITIYLNLQGKETPHFSGNVFLKAAGEEEIKCTIDKYRKWQDVIDVNVNTIYNVSTDFFTGYGDDGKGEYSNYHFVLPNGKNEGEFAITESTTNLTLTFCEIGKEEEALKKHDYKAEGTVLWATYLEAMKEVETTPKFQKYCNARYTTEESEKSPIKAFLEQDSNNTREMYVKMSPMERFNYETFVTGIDYKIIENYWENTRESFVEGCTMGSKLYGLTDKAVEAQRNVLSWLWDVWQTEHIFVNILDLENTAPIQTEIPNGKVVKKADKKSNENISTNDTAESESAKKQGKVPETAKENRFVKVLKNNWLTIVILLGATVAFLIVRQIRKSKNIDDN